MKNKLFIGLTLVACLFMFGCQQSNNTVNSNTTANTNKATNNTTNIVINTNTATNTNTAVGNANNAASTPTTTNTASTNSETLKKDEKADCEVKKDNADFFVSATEKEMKLKKGTPILDTGAPMGQGIIVVKAKVGNEWIKGEILLDDTTCN